MKLSISNIAWLKEQDTEVYKLLIDSGYDGIDIAPGRVFTDPYSANSKAISEFRMEVETYGLRVAGIQSLLYQKPDLTIFDTEEQRVKTLGLLKQMIDFGNGLKASALVFGSPKNRIVGGMNREKKKIALEFFFELGEYAKHKNIFFTLEPNPSIYGGDFLLTTTETLDFVKEVDSSGLRMNLDTGTIMVNGEMDGIQQLIKENIRYIGHVHLSMPNLKALEINEIHKMVIKELINAHYSGWVAIEMVTDDNKGIDLSSILNSVKGLIAQT